MNPAVRCASLLFLACGLIAPAPAADAPAAALADAPWKIHQTTTAIFPPRLILNGVTHGEARIRFSIAASGELVDALLVACSHREFGEEALRTLKLWRFEAEREQGRLIGVVGDITFHFQVNGPIAIEKRTPTAQEESHRPDDPLAYRAEGLKHLDGIPTPTRVVPPSYPREWEDRSIKGSATVEFYIDEKGQARVPLLLAADHPLLGAAAVAAVAQWRFEPPTRRGRPVLARAEQTFAFGRDKK